MRLNKSIRDGGEREGGRGSGEEGGGGGEEGGRGGGGGGGAEGRSESGLFRKAKAVYGRFDNGTELFMTPLRIISKNCPHESKSGIRNKDKHHAVKRYKSFSIRNSRNSRLHGSTSGPSVSLLYALLQESQKLNVTGN
ncbi:hypothetical protein HZH68_002595 [Vespula germanica]|uniref:Uncharacterized protein n=1 Tax=Vespula germanica TaxID=30212 RepID=A0A834NMQ3_VESGE|nr:hypothetical protein HZH68_002595 [Vespula germanica]